MGRSSPVDGESPLVSTGLELAPSSPVAALPVVEASPPVAESPVCAEVSSLVTVVEVAGVLVAPLLVLLVAFPEELAGLVLLLGVELGVPDVELLGPAGGLTVPAVVVDVGVAPLGPPASVEHAAKSAETATHTVVE